MFHIFCSNVYIQECTVNKSLQGFYGNVYIILFLSSSVNTIPYFVKSCPVTTFYRSISKFQSLIFLSIFGSFQALGSVVLQIVSLCTSVAAIVLCTLGLVDNINTAQDMSKISFLNYHFHWGGYIIFAFSAVRCPLSDVRCPMSGVRCPASRMVSAHLKEKY